MVLQRYVRVLAGLLIIALVVIVAPVSAAVVTIDDTTAGGIAQAIYDAGDEGTVILNPGTYNNDDIVVYNNVSIRANTSSGHSTADTIIDARHNPLLTVPAGVTLVLDNLTLRNGWAINGGAIANSGTLRITSSQFTNCGASNDGGAIHNNGGAVTIASTTFVDCRANYGGAFFSDGGSVSITTTSFTGCRATGDGGAVAVTNPTIIAITTSIFKDCTAAGTGGAIISAGHTNVHFSRFYQNTDSGTLGSTIYQIGGTMNTDNNWWGTNDGPGDSVRGDPVTSWLMLGATAAQPSITTAQTSLIRANLTYNSAGYNTIAAGHVPNGTAVTFSISSGPGSLSYPFNITTHGAAEITFTPDGDGITIINATVDGQTVNTTVSTSWAVPSITSISPPGGRVTGGESVTIHGTGLTRASLVRFGTTASPSYSNDTDTQIRAIAPAHATGPVDITVTAPGGTSPVVAGARFTYIGPEVNTGTETSDGDSPAILLSVTTEDVNVGGNSAVGRTVVTGTGISDLIVTGTTQSGPGTGIPLPPGTVYQYFELVPARYTSITGTTITFTVPAAWLEEHHLNPQDIVLHHYTGGAWKALPTTVGANANGIISLTAISPSFSLFAIAGLPYAVPTTTTTLPAQPAGDRAVQSMPTQVSVMQTPALQQTTAVPAPATSQPQPLPVLAIAIAGFIILAAGGFVIRRWWTRRQNPALFREYD